MLMTEALSGLLEVWESQRLPGMEPGFIRDRVVVCLFQAMARTLLTQNDDGSWGTSGSEEETAYGVLILSKAARLPNLGPLQARLIHSLKVGQDFIMTKQAREPSLLWVEKVTYGSEVLTEAYVLAALKASIDPSPSFGRVESLLQIPHVKLEKFVHFYSKLPLFENAPQWELALSLVEGYLFLPQIYDQRLDIFPRTGMDEDKYFEYIPFTWTSNNNLNRSFSSAKVLQQMMVVSFLNYQADEYMEAVVGRHFRGRKESAMRLVDSILEADASTPTTNSTDGSRQTLAGRGLATPEASSSDEESFGGFKGSGPLVIGSVREVLSRFIRFVLRHPEVESSTGLMQRTLKAELRRFLEAHLEQCDDNERFAAQSEHDAADKIFRRPRTSFHRWVQTTSSDHTSCPYSFMFFQCLISSNGKDCFPSMQQKYVADTLCRHLAVMCRMYNDYGSVARDWDEMNLNSVNFAEFHGAESQPDMDEAKASLFALATYERLCLDSSMRQLRKLAAAHGAQARVLEKVQMFCNVTDLYGQIYEARDIASRM